MNSSAKNHKHLPWILVSLRLFLFALLSAIGLWFYHTPYSSGFCILFICTAALLSDVFDGIFARRYLQADALYKFRCIDSIVDKVGLSIALLGFYASGQLPMVIFLFLIFRELALLLGGINLVIHGYSIRGDNIGRVYYCVLFLMVITTYPSDARFSTANLLFPTLVLLAILNLCSHALDRISHPDKLIS